MRAVLAALGPPKMHPGNAPMAPETQNTAPYQPLRAPRGLSLSCQSWQQEAVLRMLLNSLDPEVAEHPQELVIGGAAAGKAAADWDSFQSIVETLRQLAGDESLTVQSGKPSSVSRTGAAFLGIEADAEQIKRRVKTGYCEVMVNNLDEALRMLKNAVRQRKGTCVGLIGNCADLFPAVAQRGVVPDLLMDFTPAEPPFQGYVPLGIDPVEAISARQADPDAFRQRVEASIARQQEGLRQLEQLGTHVITSSMTREFLRPLLDDGWLLSLWLALSGEPRDIARLDKLALELFADEERLQHWLPLAARYVRFQGLPARVTWFRAAHFGRFAGAVNGLVARRELSAPVLLGLRLPSPESAGAPHLKPLPGACWTYESGSDPSHALLFAQAIVADGSTDAAAQMSRL
jgi:urocanate hydratase